MFEFGLAAMNGFCGAFVGSAISFAIAGAPENAGRVGGADGDDRLGGGGGGRDRKGGDGERCDTAPHRREAITRPRRRAPMLSVKGELLGLRPSNSPFDARFEVESLQFANPIGARSPAGS